MSRRVPTLALLVVVALAPLVGVAAPAAAAGAAGTTGTTQADPVRITGFEAPNETVLGDRISVNATVENTGDEQTRVTIVYQISDGVVASVTRTLVAGETATVTLTPLIQRSLDPGTYEHGVSIRGTDEKLTDQLTVRDGGAVFTVSEFQGPIETNGGARVTAEAVVENTGTRDGTMTLEYRIGGEVVSSRVVSLATGTKVTITFGATVPALPPGTYRQGVFVGDTASGSRGRVVIGPSAPRFEVLSFRAPSEAQGGDRVRATATIRSTADSSGTQTFEYRVGDRIVDTREVTLSGGQTTTVEFEGTVPDLAAGVYQQGVFQGTSNAGLTRSIRIRDPEASFAVSSLQAPLNAESGARVSATVAVRNTGDAPGSTTLRYRIDGTTVATASVTLDPDERRTVTLTGTVPSRSTGEYTQGVFVDGTDRGLTTRLRIAQEAPARDIRISNLDVPTDAQQGDEITVRATVRNAGDRTERVTIEYRIGSRVIDDVRVELAPGRSTAVRFDVRVPDLRDGTYQQGVFVAETNSGQRTSLRIEPRPRFRVSNLRAPFSAQVDDRVTVEALIENTGGSSATQTVEYRIGSRVVAARDLRLRAGERLTVRLTGTVPELAPGTYRQGVFTDRDSSTRGIEIQRPARPRATFVVSSLNAPSEIRAGGTIPVEATVRNTGNATGPVTVEYRIQGQVLASRQVVLDPAEQRTVSFAATVPDLESGSYQQGVFIAGTAEGQSTGLAIRSGTARFTVSDVRAPATVTSGDRMTVEATVTNTGDGDGRTEVQYRLDGTRLASTSVDLRAGAETTVTFVVTVPDLDARNYQHGVFVADSDRGGTTSLTIEAPETPTPTPSPTPSPTPTPTPSPTPSPTETDTALPGFGVPAILTAVGVLVVVVVLARGRHRR